MTQIRIDTDHTGQVGRRLVSAANRLDEIGRELQHAIGTLDTWAWDGASRARAEPLLGQVRPESQRLGQELDALGRKLMRVAAAFEQEDNVAARNMEEMPWVDFTPGTAVGGSSGMAGGAGSGIEIDGFAGPSWSFDREGKRERDLETEVDVKLVDGALYDAQDATGDVKVGGRDIGDYRADVQAGKYEVGARLGFGEDGFTAGAYGEVSSIEATAVGVVGGSALGLAAAGTVAGPKAEGFIGIKDNTLGVSIGGSLASAEAEVGLNVAGANVGVTGGVSLGFELGFKIGKDTEVKLGPFKVGLSFGTAKE